MSDGMKSYFHNSASSFTNYVTREPRQPRKRKFRNMLLMHPIIIILNGNPYWEQDIRECEVRYMSGAEG